MRTKSIKKAAFIYYKTGIKPEVVKDEQSINENIFDFENTDDITNASREYMQLTRKQDKLIEDKNIWKYELLVGELKKKCCAFKKGYFRHI